MLQTTLVIKSLRGLYSSDDTGAMKGRSGDTRKKEREMCAIIQFQSISGTEQDDLCGIYLSLNRRRATRSMTQSVTRCDSYSPLALPSPVSPREPAISHIPAMKKAPPVSGSHCRTRYHASEGAEPMILVPLVSVRPPWSGLTGPCALLWVMMVESHVSRVENRS